MKNIELTEAQLRNVKRYTIAVERHAREKGEVWNERRRIDTEAELVRHYRHANTVTYEEVGACVHDAFRQYWHMMRDVWLPAWEDLRDYEKDEYAAMIKRILVLPEPDAPRAHPTILHDEWAECRMMDGWCYAEIYDEALKRSPELVPYANLSLDAQVKYRLALAITGVIA